VKFIRREPNYAYLGDWLWIPKSFVDPKHLRKVLVVTSMSEREVRVVDLYKETKDHLLVPRAYWKYTDLPYELIDCRPRTYEKTCVKSKVVLDWDPNYQAQHPTRTIQREAAAALRTVQGGILQLACGRGKTVIAINFFCELGVPAIILVDNTNLLGQWKQEILDFTDLTEKDIGQVGDGKFDWKKPVVLATYQTVASRADELPEDFRRWFGLAIWDEGHHLGAETFSRTAPLFYGYRLALSATPERADGMHRIYQWHLGDVIYKNLTPDMKTDVAFLWTGLCPDQTSADFIEKACDKTGEIHFKKLSAFFGQWDAHIEFVLNEVRLARQHGRKVLVLSESVDELCNLFAAWKGFGRRYSDIPYPTTDDVNEKLPPCALIPKERKQLETKRGKLFALLEAKETNPKRKRHILEELIPDINVALQRDDVAKKLEREYEKRQRVFQKELLAHAGDAGLMIGDVKPASRRQEMLDKYNVTFAIMKYGKEGMNSKTLDTVIMTTPVSDRNILQQILGRPSRLLPGKKQPTLTVLEHEVGQIIGMCKKMRSHLRVWPADEGGPYEVEDVGYPQKQRQQFFDPRR
jgi:superfamily II DNA or RNA helicase